MIRVLYRHRSGTLIDDLPLTQVPAAIKDSQARVWIDLQGATPEEYRLVLDQMFRFHPLAVEDAINEVHIPKVDDYGPYVYVVVHSFRLGDERMDIDTYELDIFLGANFLVTIHERISESVDLLWKKEYHVERGLARGTALLLYELMDRQLDRYIPLLDQFEARVEELGDLIVKSDSPFNERAVLNDILTAKSSALRLRRILLPQREVFVRLARDHYDAIPNDARIYFQDLYDHIVRLADLAESMRDLVNGTMTTHLTLSSNRLNEVMKVLTIISTIFMPLSFVAGIYGMNFHYMPELSWRWGYLMVWLIFIGISAVMLREFRRRRWI
jgi:magnesium transporter